MGRMACPLIFCSDRPNEQIRPAIKVLTVVCRIEQQAAIPLNKIGTQLQLPETLPIIEIRGLACPDAGVHAVTVRVEVTTAGIEA